MMVVFLRRSGGQSQFSATLAAQAGEGQPLRDLLTGMAGNLRQDTSIATLARRAENLRLEAARRQLETTASSLEEVADASGFRSAEILRRTFTRRLGVTPGQFCSDESVRWLERFVVISGLIYDVATGLVEVVVPPAPIRTA
jgi:transcriptional regulator GlxA family with amidase domain